MFDSVFGKSFNSAKCKTLLRLAIARIKLLRNKRDIQLKQMKRELVQLLQTNQEPSARIRVEHIFREQNTMAAYEIIELFCELIVVRLPIIDSQRQCPIDLKEAVASIIFAAPRCSDLAELLQVRNLFGAKYGKEFVAAAAELRPDCGVNRLVIEKLSIKPPSGEVKLKLMKDIANELKLDWDPTVSESELLKTPEDLLEGSTKFLSATQMPLQEPISQPNQDYWTGERNGASSRIPDGISDEKKYVPFVSPTAENRSPSGADQELRQDIRDQPPVFIQNDKLDSVSRATSFYNNDREMRHNSASRPPSFHHNDQQDGYSQPLTFDHNDREMRQGSHKLSPTFDHNDVYNDDEEEDNEHVVYTKDTLNDVAAAAQAAAKAAERAASAARAAALLADKHFDRNTSGFRSDHSDDDNDQEGDNYTHKKGDLVNNVNYSFTEHRRVKNELSSSPQFDEEGSSSVHNMPYRKQNTFDGDDYLYSREEQQERELGRKDTNIPSRDSYSKRFSSHNWRFDDDNEDDNGGSTWHTDHPSNTRNINLDSYESSEIFAEDRSPGVGQSSASHIHPNLPDYDKLAAQFQRLKSKR